MKKNSLSIAAILLGSTLPLFGDSSCCPKPCTPTCCPPIVEDCCSFSRCPPTTQITPNAGPRVKNGWDFYSEASFTYWTAHEEGLTFALIEDDATVGTYSPVSNVVTPDFDWRPGFQLGAGMDFCHDGWDVFLNYTWFQSSHNTRSISIDPAGTPDIVDAYWLVNQPFFITNLTSDPPILHFYENAHAKWGLRLNVFDLELGRNCYLSRRMTLRPYVGLKGMWERQSYGLNFNHISMTGVDTFTSIMYNKLSNWGIGVRTGFNTAWHFYDSFSLLGEFAITGLWEQFKTHRKDSMIQPVAGFGSAPGTAVSVNNQYNFYTLKPVLEWFLGFRWETWTCSNAYHFAIDAGWEQQLWFGQNQFLKIDALDADHGNLGLQGLTARFRFDF